MQYKKLIELADIITTNNMVYETSQVFVTHKDIHNNFVFNKNVMNGVELPSKTVSKLKENDIIICKLENADDVILIDKYSKDYVFSSDFVIIRPKTDEYKYLYFYFISDYFKNKKKELLSGINKRILKVDTIEKLDILYIEENDDFDFEDLDSFWKSYHDEILRLSNLISKNDSKLDTICNYYILGKNKSNKEIREDLSLEVPENWQVFRINEIVEKIIEGQKKSLRYIKTGVPVLFDVNILNNELDLVNVKYISEKDSKYLNNNFTALNGDVLISKKNGLCYQVKDITYFNISEGTVSIRPDLSKININYFFMLMNSLYVKRFFQDKTKQIDTSNIGNIPIVLPPLEEQQQIVDILIQYINKNGTIKTRALNKINEMEKTLLSKINNLFK